MWQGVSNERRAMGQDQHTVEEALRPASRTAGLPRVLFLDESAEEDAAPPPKLTGRRVVFMRAARLAVLGAAGFLASAGLVRLGPGLGAPASLVSAAEPDARPTLPPQVQVDGAADTLALATSAFDLRVRLFQSHQMQCPDLARGLVLVEQRWTEYTAAQAATWVARDSAHTALARSLNTSVDAAERQFEQSKCPRP